MRLVYKQDQLDKAQVLLHLDIEQDLEHKEQMRLRLEQTRQHKDNLQTR